MKTGRSGEKTRNGINTRHTNEPRGTDLRELKAEAVAWSERSYSLYGIAEEMDSSKGTIEKYHEEVIALHGIQVAGARTENKSPPPVPDRVEPGYHRELVDAERQRWLTYVDRHRNTLLQSWVNDVLNEAREDLPLERLLGE